jgi:hypothetical protein
MPGENLLVSPLDQISHWTKVMRTDTNIHMTNESFELEMLEEKWVSKIFNKGYPKSKRSTNGKIFEMFAGFLRFQPIYIKHFTKIIMHDINRNFLRAALNAQGRLMRENDSIRKRIEPAIDTIYMMDGRFVEFTEKNSVLLGFGCLGYFNDYSARRFLISACGYFKDILLRESIIHDNSIEMEDIDDSQQYKIRTYKAYLSMFEQLGF